MNIKFYFVTILLLLALSGCASLNPKRLFHSPVEDHVTRQDSASALIVESGKILNPERLRNGGKLLILPFRAGEGVEANEELDQIALSIIKGMSEQLQAQESSWEVVLNERAEEADFILEGHITAVKKSGSFRKWVLRKDEILLSADGKMMDRSSQESVFIFSDTKKTLQKREDHKQLGIRMGRDIGGFLLSGS